MTILDEVRGPALEPAAPAPPPERPARTDGPLSTRIVDKLGNLLLARTSRRGFLATTAVTGAALVTAPKTYALTPTTAYSSICGDGASCSSGWTAFCCTVNAGKNSCPPGALAGGWWKADGSGYCCGSSKYIIDCHYTCNCGCASGQRICSSACTGRSCTCATGDCDQRRTNCNQFRYGQCNTHVSCVGPVLCRVVTCTPPWRLENCTTSSATDNRTGNHSSSCLPGRGCLATIDQWWWDNGGPGNSVGNPLESAVSSPASGVTRRNYANGHVFHRASTGIVVVSSPLRDRYSELGSWTSPLGFPVRNQQAGEGGGVLQAFDGGALYWLPNRTPVVALWGGIQQRFVSQGDIRGLGWPVAMNEPVAGGVRDTTTNARIYTNAAGQSFVLSGAFLSKYLESGETAGALGFPTGAVRPVGGLKQYAASGRGGGTQTMMQTFQRGEITSGPGGTHVRIY